MIVQSRIKLFKSSDKLYSETDSASERHIQYKPHKIFYSTELLEKWCSENLEIKKLVIYNI